MSDQLIRFVTRNSHFRAIAAETTDLCETARRLHGTDPTATVALARATTGTALMGGLLKGDQRLALSIEGNGPLQRLQAETDAKGHIRCSIKNPLANLPPCDNGFDVANAIGKAGFLNIIKDLGLKEPYCSTVQLQTSEIGDDIAYYLTTSEQVPSSVSLGVLLGSDAEVKIAGGFIIQALPGCDDEVIDQIEAKINALPGISSLLCDGESPGTILETIFAGFDCSEPESIPLVFRCSCNQRQVTGILKGMGPEELSSLAEKGEAVDVTCEYCRKAYRFSPDELSALRG